jgi:hypothetical protein
MRLQAFLDWRAEAWLQDPQVARPSFHVLLRLRNSLRVTISPG